MRTYFFALLLGGAMLGCGHPSGPSSGIPNPGTAAGRFPSIDSLAKSVNPSLRLMVVRSDKVMPDGFSRVWYYAYGNTENNTGLYWFHSNSKGIGFDSISEMQPGIGLVTHDWCNSDSAMGVAEREGGADFRDGNSPCTVTASLGELAVTDRITRWWIIYRSRENPKGLMFAINASTGRLILTGP